MSSNISWAKDMGGYLEEKDRIKRRNPPAQVEKKVIEHLPDEELIKMLETVKNEFKKAYEANPRKELYDSIINLERVELN